MLLRRLKPFGIPFGQIIKNYYTVKRKILKDEFYVARQIYQKIQVKGPLTVADYMREVLTNPLSGYYMHKDMIGEQGDFITSPEVTQMFGEMIGIWLLNEWQKIGSPKPLQIVELGPGRGTLSCDILNIFSHFSSLSNTSLKLVEVSPSLSEVQARKICCQSSICNDDSNKNSTLYRKGVTNQGTTVEWYRNLKDVPNAFSLIVAHEFFDALPIHKFQKCYSGYREVLIDIDPTSEKKDENWEPKFRYVIANHDTPMSKALLNPKETRDHVEVCMEAIFTYQEIAKRIKESGGISLICDYGHCGEGTDTFRAYKKHKQVDPLELPGTADLTADVDFKLMREVVHNNGGVITYGPISQREFLLRTGLEYRLKSLIESCKTDHEQIQNLNECFEFLVGKNKMGERFKFFAIFPETTKNILSRIPVVGFS